MPWLPVQSLLDKSGLGWKSFKKSGRNEGRTSVVGGFLSSFLAYTITSPKEVGDRFPLNYRWEQESGVRGFISTIVAVTALKRRTL